MQSKWLRGWALAAEPVCHEFIHLFQETPSCKKFIAIPYSQPAPAVTRLRSTLRNVYAISSAKGSRKCQSSSPPP